MNSDYANIIEKKAENMYRTINQRLASLPASNQAVKKMVSSTKNIDLTPQESEQLSQYASDDGYVQRQKADIQELTSLFKDMMGTDEKMDELYSEKLTKAFKPMAGFKAVYKCNLEGRKKALFIRVNGASVECVEEAQEEIDVEIHLTPETMEEIMMGRMSFQRAFMSGDMKMKGDFKILRALDQIFVFAEQI